MKKLIDKIGYIVFPLIIIGIFAVIANSLIQFGKLTAFEELCNSGNQAACVLLDRGRK